MRPHSPPSFDEQGRRLDVIELRGLVVECIVGVYPAERVRPQPVRLDVDLALDTRAAAASGRIEDTVNYARLAGELGFLLHACHFKMLETAADALCRYVLAPPTPDAPRARVSAVTLRMSKPDALARPGEPSLEVHRTAGEFPTSQQTKPFGAVDLLFERAELTVYRLRLAAGASLAGRANARMEQHELVLGHGVRVDGAPVKPGVALHWPPGVTHRLDNPTGEELSLLCVDTPGVGAGATKSYYPSEEQ